MEFPQIWPRLGTSSRSWLMEHNGEPLPDNVIANILSVTDGNQIAQWWTGSSVEGQTQLTDEAVDWIETVAKRRDLIQALAISSGRREVCPASSGPTRGWPSAGRWQLMPPIARSRGRSARRVLPPRVDHPVRRVAVRLVDLCGRGPRNAWESEKGDWDTRTTTRVQLGGTDPGATDGGFRVSSAMRVLFHAGPHGKEVLMRRANIAAVIGLAMLSTTSCGRSGTVVAGVSGRAPSSSSSANPQRGSACLTTPVTGDSTVMVDWVDFVRLHGIEYIAGLDGNVPAVASDQLGSVVGRVECRLSGLKFQAEPGPAVDGDAAFLDAGTQMHSIRGYEPSCRLAAPIGGVNRVYLAHADVGGVSKAVPCAKAP